MRMSVAKAMADLRAQGAKAALLWLAIAIGALAVMAAFGARAVLEREVARSFDESRPAAVVVWTDDVDAALMKRVSMMPGVEGVDARRLVRTRVEVADKTWRSLLLYGVRDFADIRVSRVHSVDGAWPPPPGSALVERSAVSVLAKQTGGTLSVRIPGAQEPQALAVAGLAHDPAQAPGWQDNLGYAYVTPATLGQLGLGTQLDQLQVDTAAGRTAAQAVATRVQRLLADAGRPVLRVEISPRKHPHADHMRAMLLLLRVLAALSLLLSALLAANLFGSMLARQTREVGVMKAIGGSPARIARIFLLLAATVSGSAAIVGALGGVMVAKRFARFAGEQLNLYDIALSVPSDVVALVWLAATFVPLAATLWPIVRASRVNVREAIRDPGIQWDRAPRTAGLRRLSVSLRLSLRNSLRRRGRFVLTVVSFALGGAMLMAAANVHRSLVGAVDESVEQRADGLEVRFLRPASTTELVAAAQKVDGVQRAIPWGAVLAGFSLPQEATADGRTVAGRYGLLAPPNGERHASATVVQGRWPSKDEGHYAVRIVVNRQLLALEPHLRVGAKTTLLLGQRSTSATVVGVVEEIAPASAYVTPEDMARVIGQTQVSGAVRLVLHEGVSAASVATELEAVLAERGWFPVYLMTKEELRAAMVDHFMILLVVLLALAAAAILVGVLGLSTTMSINVMSRRREIGVSKAMGASAGQLRRLILTEGAVTTAVSLLVALLLSVPLSAFVGYVAGSHGLHVTLPYTTSPEAIVVWVLLASLNTVLACLGPAEDAVRRPVRELIAYE